MLTGMYVRGDGARVFTPCGERDVVPVAPQDDAVTLDAFYTRAQPYARRPAPRRNRRAHEAQPTANPGAAPATLVVTRFVAGWPGEMCPVPDVRMPLEQSYWRLTRLGEEPLLWVGGNETRAPRLVLDGGTLAGFGGCNQLAGQYMLQDELTPTQGALTFSGVTATRVACQTGMDTETAFLTALARVRRFSVSGIHLDLLDDARGRLLRFEVRALRISARRLRRNRHSETATPGAVTVSILCLDPPGVRAGRERRRGRERTRSGAAHTSGGRRRHQFLDDRHASPVDPQVVRRCRADGLPRVGRRGIADRAARGRQCCRPRHAAAESECEPRAPRAVPRAVRGLDPPGVRTGRKRRRGRVRTISGAARASGGDSRHPLPG